MKKSVITLILSIIVSLGISSSAVAATKTIKKTVVEGESCVVRTPAIDKKISKVSVAKAGKSNLSAKRVSGKKAVKLTGKLASDTPITVTVKVGKKKYKYSVSVVSMPKNSASVTTEKPKETTKTYHNNGTKCTCGGEWEKITFTDEYAPSCWYLGYADTLKRDVAQTWTKYEMTTDCYYPLRVSAVEEGYNYDHSDLVWRGYEDSADVALSMDTIPRNYKGLNILQGNIYPVDTGLQWTDARGGQVAKISLNDFKQSQVVDTGYYRCKKCGAIKQ